MTVMASSLFEKVMNAVELQSSASPQLNRARSQCLERIPMGPLVLFRTRGSGLKQIAPEVQMNWSSPPTPFVITTSRTKPAGSYAKKFLQMRANVISSWATLCG